MAVSSLPLGLILLVISGVQALQVTPGSSCSDVCQSSSTTDSSDIVCEDVDYYSSSSGATFKDCVECLQMSNATSNSENDVSWFLYNLRYASAVCLYDFPRHRDNSTSSCDLEYACAPLQGALESGNLVPSNETEYGYCQAGNDAFYGTAIDDCVSCLQSSSSNYMANFLLALEAGCEQEPVAGQILSISGDIFSEDTINITNSTNSTSSNSTSSNDDGALTTGAKLGIGVGIGGLFLAALILFVIYYLRQRGYEEQAHADTHPYSFRGQHFYPQEPDSGPANMSTAQNYVLQNYTVDYKSQLSGPTVSGAPTPEPEYHRPDSHPDPADYINNAEYYDALEGKSRGGRPLKALPLRLHPTGVSENSSNSGTGTLVGGNNNVGSDNSALPIHPAYIPRSQFPGQLGGRASRNTNNGDPRSGSSSQRSSSTVSSSTKKQEWRKSNKPADSYAIQVYLNTPEEPKISSAPPARNIQLGLGASRADDPFSSSSVSSYDGRSHTMQQLSPPSVPTNGRGTPVPPPPPQGGRDTPAPMQFKANGRSILEAASSNNYGYGIAGERSQPPPPPPRLPSLILPSVPRIRVPGSKKVLQQQPSRSEEPVPFNRDTSISGPLAFPDSRFSARPAHDRIIKQTADRGEQFMEVPIGSGKSYLYG